MSCAHLLHLPLSTFLFEFSPSSTTLYCTFLFVLYKTTNYHVCTDLHPIETLSFVRSTLMNAHHTAF